MSFLAVISRWISQNSKDRLERAIPSYRLACNNERVSQKRGNTQGVGRARKQMREALHAALRVKAVGRHVKQTERV